MASRLAVVQVRLVHNTPHEPSRHPSTFRYVHTSGCSAISTAAPANVDDGDLPTQPPPASLLCS
jgi:hypothetical protein